MIGREKLGLAVVALMVTVLAASMARADDKETLKLMLINGGAIIGQSITCGRLCTLEGMFAPTARGAKKKWPR
jgi:hypothetical protein